MKEKWQAMPAFRRGILLYALILAVLLGAVWLLTWQYAAAYEASRHQGVLNEYVEQTLKAELTDRIAAAAAEHASPMQSAEDISAELTERVLNGKWLYKEAPASTDEAPIYVLYCGGVPVGTAHLTQGTPGFLDFGMAPWAVSGEAADLSTLGTSITVIAPPDSNVTVNGCPLTETQEESLKVYPLFAEYEALIKDNLALQTYTVSDLFAKPVVEADTAYMVVEQEPNVFYVLPAADAAVSAEMLAFAEEFVDVYFQYTSNATTIYHLQRYVHLRSELYQRIYKSLDGMSWVSGVTGSLTDLELRDLVYYGNAAVVEADYTLDMKKTEDKSGSMHIVLAKSSYSWRVVSIEMY